MAKSEVESSKALRIAETKKKLEKDFGKGTLIGGKDKPKFHEAISTGSMGLDKALGIGGLPKGRIIEIYGPESSGKTTLATHIISEAHKTEDSYCAFVDAEHAFDTGYAEALGVDLGRLEISQPDYGEQALEITSRLIESGDFDVIVVDSVAALVPKAELDGEMGDSRMGTQSRLMSQAMRKLVAATSKSGTVLIFINQLRDKIGVMFGSPETTTGGNALKFYASVRLDVRRSVSAQNSVMEGDLKVGNQVTVKVIKNKMAPPFRQAQFDILYGTGIDKQGELIDMAVDAKVVNKSGSWFSYEDMKIGQGRAAVAELLKDNEELSEEIRKKVLQTFEVKDFIPTEAEKQENE